MKSEIFLSVLLAASAAGGGYWFGQRHAHSTSAITATNQLGNTSGAKTLGGIPTLPPIHAATDTNTTPTLGKLSLADIEAKLLELKKKGSISYGFGAEQDFMKLMVEIDPADIPAVMAFVDKNLP